jgi:hypothetical protein
VSPLARRGAAVSAGLLLALGVWYGWPLATGEVAGSGDTSALSPATSAALPIPLEPSEPAAAPPPHAHAAALAQWVHSRSALRGAALDGGWGLNSAGQLQPSLALRRRFDHLLQLQGQLSLAQITDYLVHLAQPELNATQTEAVLQVWQRYLSLQQTAFTTVVRADDPASLAAALAERQQARRQWLGLDWAQAFYGVEEAALTELILRPPGATPPHELIKRSALSPAAQQRLAEEEAAQADWALRLNQARVALQVLQRAPELSALQRGQAVDDWLVAHFDASQQRRVRALLGLPPL